MHGRKKSATATLRKSMSTDPIEDDHLSLSSHLALQQLHDGNEITTCKERASAQGATADDASEAEFEDNTVAGVMIVDDNSFNVECGAVGGAKTVEEVSATCDTRSQDVWASCSGNIIQWPPMPVAPKSSKKRSKFWSFWKRGRRSTTLPKCIETGEDESVLTAAVPGSCSISGSCEKDSCQSGNSNAWPANNTRHGSPRADSPTPGNMRRLSMGAGSRSFGTLNSAQLMAAVPPAPHMQTLNSMATHAHVVLRQDLNLRLDDSSSNQIGYPLLHFSQSLSNSSSSSSGICAPLLPAPDYPPFSLPPPTVHTQVDYMHCLVPDLLELTNCCFYWGVMDRYEAERLLEGRPEGTFLVRDSAQEEFLFSVSFRRYGRSLHARIEQWNHRFSFDSHDPDVFGASSVCSLVEHYKDPAACMFFEPMLTLPLPRVFAFTLQHLCRAVICSRVNYDNVSALHLPRPLQEYLKYYHYKQRICVRRFESQ